MPSLSYSVTADMLTSASGASANCAAGWTTRDMATRETAAGENAAAEARPRTARRLRNILLSANRRERK